MIFAHDAVEGAREQMRAVRLVQRSTEPGLREQRADEIAGLDAGDAGAGLDHAAGAVGKHDQGKFAGVPPVAAADHDAVAEVEGGRLHLDHDLAGTGLGIGAGAGPDVFERPVVAEFDDFHAGSPLQKAFMIFLYKEIERLWRNGSLEMGGLVRHSSWNGDVAERLKAAVC